MNRHLLLWLCAPVLLCWFSACTEDDFITADPQLVVEGWIDSDGFPVVILTTTLPISNEYCDYNSLEQHLVKWAKVTVSDGEQEVILTGKVDNDYYPPYVYTTGQLRGVAGKRYRLTVEYDNFHAEAETVIPSPVPIDSFQIEQAGGDSLYQVTACFSHKPNEENRYKFFVYTDRDAYTSFSSAYLGLVNGETAGSYLRIPVYRSHTLEHWEDYTPYFSLGETVTIKLATLDSISYSFWETYEELTALSRNPFFSLTENLNSNIQGGLGYWIGYGTTQYKITVR